MAGCAASRDGEFGDIGGGNPGVDALDGALLQHLHSRQPARESRGGAAGGCCLDERFGQPADGRVVSRCQRSVQPQRLAGHGLDVRREPLVGRSARGLVPRGQPVHRRGGGLLSIADCRRDRWPSVCYPQSDRRHRHRHIAGRRQWPRRFAFDGHAAHGAATARRRQSVHRRARVVTRSAGGHRGCARRRPGRAPIPAGARNQSTAEPAPHPRRRPACGRRHGRPGGVPRRADHHRPGTFAITRLSRIDQGTGSYGVGMARSGTRRPGLWLACAASGG